MRRFNITIGQCMTTNVHTLDVKKFVSDAAKMLREKKVGSIIIIEGKDAIGIITERDIVYKVVAEGKDAKKIPLKGIMSKPLKTLKAEQTVHEAALAMRQSNIKRLPVLDKKGKLVGIITESDLMSVYPGIIDIMTESPHMRNDKD
ncbi:MAG: CBS domain-containing protein [Candidatus Micrarchaeota archaeon]